MSRVANNDRSGICVAVRPRGALAEGRPNRQDGRRVVLHRLSSSAAAAWRAPHRVTPGREETG